MKPAYRLVQAWIGRMVSHLFKCKVTLVTDSTLQFLQMYRLVHIKLSIHGGTGIGNKEKKKNKINNKYIKLRNMIGTDL